MTHPQHEFRMLGSSVQVQNFGDEFLLLRAKDMDASTFSRLGRCLFERQFSFVAEVIATEVEICLKLNQRFDQHGLVQLQQLETLPAATTNGDDRTVLRLPVWFSTDDDWQTVCKSTGLDRATYLQRLLECQFQVAMIGFLPGFVYLNGLPDSLQVARKSNPDRQAEANSFAVGGRYAGIYSLPSPAGWNVLGRLGISLLQTNQLPPVALQPGDQLTLESVNQADYHQLLRTGATLEQFNG